MKFFLVIYQIEGQNQPTKWTVLRTVSAEVAKKDMVWRDNNLASRSVKWHVIACIPIGEIYTACEKV